MTVLVTWNIQCGRGVDGRIDLARIARTVMADGAPDVLCLQEVARHMPALDGGAGTDQVQALTDLFPGYEAAYGAAVDHRGRDGTRARFGNLVLSRHPILDVLCHALPRPAEAGVLHMPRQATEVAVDLPGGALRVATTHLEFHAARQRLAQVERLRERHQEASANARAPAATAPEGSPYADAMGFETAIVCGDFNALPDDPVYRRMLDDFDGAAPEFADAWRVCHPDAAHAATCGVHDREQWPEGPHCRDFVFVTTDLTNRIRSVEVDTGTAASDHQPVRLVLSDPA